MADGSMSATSDDMSLLQMELAAEQGPIFDERCYANTLASVMEMELAA